MMSSPAAVSGSPMPRHDKLFPSPWKGKAKEEDSWQLEWWDIHPLVERVQIPLAWSRSSIIFTAHPTQPLVMACLFPSSKPCVVPSPPQIVSSPSSFEPPTIISVASSDEWLFAYFPGCEGGGGACLWRRGPQVDDWQVKEWWTYARGAGAVAMTWIGQEREWATSNSGSSSRLPPLGPGNPVSDPTLLVVTESHHVHLCYLRPDIPSPDPGKPSLKSLTCSLMHPSASSESAPAPVQDIPNTPGGIKTCVTAAIGLCYDDPGVVIAMRSQLVPSPYVNMPSYQGMDLDMSLEMSQPIPSSAETSLSLEWETWRELSTIELCEVQLGFDGWTISISTTPLPPLSHSVPHLSSLTFVSVPPSSSASIPTTSPTLSTVAPGSPKKGGENGANNKRKEPSLYLAASFFDFGDYVSLPKAEIAVYSLYRDLSSASSCGPAWSSRLQSSRCFTSNIPTFISPPPSSLNCTGLLVGILDSAGTVSRSKSRVKQVHIGNIEMLKISDLSNDETWERSPIMCPLESVGRDLPQRVAISPNNALVCTVSSLSMPDKRPCVHPFPRPLSAGKMSGSLTGARTRDLTAYATSALVCSVHSRKPPSDIVHLLSLSLVTLTQIEEVLYGALSAMDNTAFGLSDRWIGEVVGVAVEIYRGKAQSTKDETSKQDLSGRWQTAHDLCSVVACNSVFEDCWDGEGYDLEAVWESVSICTWTIDFVEKLTRECILSDDGVEIDEPRSEAREDLFGSNPSSPVFEHQQSLPSGNSPILMYLIHPYMLGNLRSLIGHIKGFRNYLAPMPAGGENAHIAKTVLMDLVDSSGVDMNGLDTLLDELREVSQNVNKEALRRSLASCRPSSALDSSLVKAVRKVVDSPIIDKPRLFIKPSDLVDGLSKMSMNEQRNKDKERDVVSKGLLLKRGLGLRCLRCGGTSEVGRHLNVAAHASDRWRACERMWKLRCICGGLWSS